MPQSVATLLNAPPAPSKRLSTPTPSKPTNNADSSFHAALNQIKNKAKPPTPPAHKAPAPPKAPAKPTAHKLASASKKAKPVVTKSDAQPAPKKAQSDNATKDPFHDSHPDSDQATDSSPDTQEDPSQDVDSAHDPSDAAQDTSASSITQTSQAAEQAVSARLPVADSTDDEKDVHEKHDHEDRKDSDSASSSEAGADSSAIAGQLTSQAVTAIKQTSDQPDKQNAPSDPSDNPGDAPVAPAASQTPSSGKAHARAVQLAKNQNPDPNAQTPDPATSQASVQPSTAPQQDAAATPASKSTAKPVDDVLSKSSVVQGLINTPGASKTDGAKGVSSPQAPQRPEIRFAEANHPTIVSEIQGKLLPTGGTMDIHLTPQDLGSVHVRVEVRDGSITATFQAADNDTAKLLSHSLTDLKSSLEAQGIAVDKLHVTHSPQDQHPSQNNNSNSRRDSDPHQQQAFQQEQQRRDMMRRMWRRVMKGQDPLDLVA